MLRIGKYTSVPKSRVLMFKQVDKNTPFDFQGNAKWCREKAIPSVSSQFLYLSHSNYIPTFIAFFWGVIIYCLFQPSTLEPEYQNRL